MMSLMHLFLLLLQEVKLSDQQRIRALFERAAKLQLPPKKMKFLFSRSVASVDTVLRVKTHVL